MGDVFLDLNSREWIVAFLGLIGDSNWCLLTMGSWMHPSENGDILAFFLLCTEHLSRDG